MLLHFALWSSPTQRDALITLERNFFLGGKGSIGVAGNAAGHRQPHEPRRTCPFHQESGSPSPPTKDPTARDVMPFGGWCETDRLMVPDSPRGRKLPFGAPLIQTICILSMPRHPRTSDAGRRSRGGKIQGRLVVGVGSPRQGLTLDPDLGRAPEMDPGGQAKSGSQPLTVVRPHTSSALRTGCPEYVTPFLNRHHA